MLAAPEHQEMNGQVEVTWRTLRTVAHSLMVHARVPEVYVIFALLYITDHIFPVLPIKDLINEDGDPTTPHKLATGTKPSVSHLLFYFVHVLFLKLWRTSLSQRAPYLSVQPMDKIKHVNVTLKVSYLLQVCVALLDRHPRL